MSSRQNPLLLSSCYCYGYRFWGALSLSRVLWKSAYSRSNMKPKSIPKQVVLRQHFMFLSCCIDLHAFSVFPSSSFHLHASSFHCASISFHVPVIFIPMCIHVLSSSFHLHACSLYFAFMSFHFLSKVEMALWLGQGTECNK